MDDREEWRGGVRDIRAADDDYFKILRPDIDRVKIKEVM